ncbi:MAG: type II 3-dehydroquinate dehydratase [Trueperaceae bacterium]
MILVLNGPNLNLLGTREPEVYGSLSLAEIDVKCRSWGQELGLRVECRQSNSEGELIDWLQKAKSEGARGVILNAAGYTHSSVALRDTISALDLPVIEVHLSNVSAREPFRQVNLLSPVCRGTITGLGQFSYKAALTALSELLLDAPR